MSTATYALTTISSLLGRTDLYGSGVSNMTSATPESSIIASANLPPSMASVSHSDDIECENITSPFDSQSGASIKAVTFILVSLSVFGAFGNGLVLYVFTRKSDRATSTIFILALAWTDFFTCLLIMPFTLSNIYLQAKFDYEFVCKLYQFLITCNVPLSAFIMAAIAVDRYFNICHPFLRLVTPRRARITIVCLCLLSFLLGTITALMVSVYKNETITETAYIGDVSWCPNVTVDDPQVYFHGRDDNENLLTTTPLTSVVYRTGTHHADSMHSTPETSTQVRETFVQNMQVIVGNASLQTTTTTKSAPNTVADDTGTCTRKVARLCYNDGNCDFHLRLFSVEFLQIFQKITISFYIISLVIVFTLYFFIYRSVVRRRAWRRKQKSWSHAPMTTAAVTTVDNGNTFVTKAVPGEGMELCQKENHANEENTKNVEDEAAHSTPNNNAETAADNADSSDPPSNTADPPNTLPQEPSPLVKQVSYVNGVPDETSKYASSIEKKKSRERRDFNFLANIRTAVMLFVVAVVFIISFLPAWLMAASLVPYNIVIFYMHFIYNVANPIIYAFMNQSFRKELKRVFQRGTNFLRSG